MGKKKYLVLKMILIVICLMFHTYYSIGSSLGFYPVFRSSTSMKESVMKQFIPSFNQNSFFFSGVKGWEALVGRQALLGEEPSVRSGGKKRVDETRIHRTGVGLLKLGMDIKDIYQIYPKKMLYKVYVYDSEHKYLQYQVITIDDKLSLLINPLCKTDSSCTVSQVIIKHPRYKTDRNIIVGHTLDDLTLAYGYLFPHWEEGNLILANKEGMHFIMDTSGIPHDWFSCMDINDLPIRTPIVGISIQ